MSGPPLVKPFRALRPRPDRAADVVAPPYDVVDTEEARALAEGRSSSFLHISRPEIDFAPGVDAHSAEVYARGAANLARLVEAGTLEREAAQCFYAYRMTMPRPSGPHTQTGIAMTASVAAYDENRVRKHELTRQDKEDDRVRNIDSLNAQTGPVLSAFRASPSVAALLTGITRGAPLFTVEGPNRVEHTVWRVDAPETVAALDSALNALDVIYIADGHHRSAAASRVARARREAMMGAGMQPTGHESHEYFLTVAFADSELEILDYNRTLADLNGLSPAAFLARVAERFDVTSSEGPAKPARPREFGLYLDGRWHRLASRDASKDPVNSLDVSILQRELVAPILGIADPRDARIDFVGGIRGLEALEARVDDGRAAAAFALFPTSMGQLMAVADAARLMPPKSTWFEPKLADGLLSHVLD